MAATSHSPKWTIPFLVIVWLGMFLCALFYVHRYSITFPFVDEWDFVEVLVGKEKWFPWLWKQHNEHRFPLPRIIYLTLMNLTSDFRSGCYLSVVGIGGASLWLMCLARRLRGYSYPTDAIFPLFFLHTAQDENYYMGYQLCFMLIAVLAIALLSTILLTTTEKVFRQACIGLVIGMLLLTCGAAGLAFGTAAACWVGWLAISTTMSRSRRLLLLTLCLLTPLYIVVYFQGYARPSHHPETPGMLASIDMALQAQTMAFGPAATFAWPLAAILLSGLFLLTFLGLAWMIWQDRINRQLWMGLGLFIGAGLGIALGIGWGRSGINEKMGFAWRYGWLVLPTIVAVYFAALLYPKAIGYRLTQVFLVVAVLVTPGNQISGFNNGERELIPWKRGWEMDIRAGLTADQIARKYHGEMPESGQQAIAHALRDLRDAKFRYYQFLAPDEDRAP
jgi:hypothetical protein